MEKQKHAKSHNMSQQYYEKYYELLNSIIVYQTLQNQLPYFENYNNQIKYQNQLLHIQMNELIGKTELRMALAKAIICQNSEILTNTETEQENEK